MNHIPQQQPRILAIAPSTRGFGFAVLEGEESLVDWGVKSVKGDKNTESLVKVKELIAHYQPGVMVLQDTATKQSRRSVRIRALSQKIMAVAATRKVNVALFSPEQVRRVFFADGQGTKHALAEILAKRFPEELGSRLPPKRRPWMSEDYRVDIFEAVALVLVLRVKEGNGRHRMATPL
jgi:Holliday junction resolvasome RuvABC endonuclease subunit